MSEAKHTPGPWRVVIDDTGGEFTGWPSIVAPPSIDCSVIHRAGFKQEFWGDLYQRDCIANARLIAAAPDLLEALVAIDNELRAAWSNGSLPDSVIPAKLAQQCSAAIAKATGKTP